MWGWEGQIGEVVGGRNVGLDRRYEREERVDVDDEGTYLFVCCCWDERLLLSVGGVVLSIICYVLYIVYDDLETLRWFSLE